jgi:bla regulator protein blaR1
MKSIDLSAQWMQSLGWTLLHSLWQAPLIFIVLFLFLKSTSSRQPHLRYGAATFSLILVLVTSAITFLLIQPASVGTALNFGLPFDNEVTQVNTESTGGLSIVNQGVVFIDQNLIWITRLWLAGSLFFLARLAAGFYFIERIRRNATPVPEVWAERVQALALQMNIQRIVQFAEAHIDTPVVIGFAKPVILFPIGLLSGLSTAQVEAILIHELSHVQRHDFAVNIFQGLMEAIFFFNPIVWLMSAYIRQEREHCCDDRVLATGASPLVYAQTLAQLEEARLIMPLAMGLSADKNLLLQRIKRIMEKSVAKNSERGRVLPIMLLLVGLACMSWLTIQRTAPEEETDQPDQEMVASDTTVKSKSKKGTTKVETRSVTRWDKNGVPHEEIEEVYEGESDLWGEADWDAPFAMEIPDMPEMVAVPDFAEAQAWAAMPPFGERTLFDLHMDSLPDKFYHRYNEEEWRAFEEEFKTKFRLQFGDFWEKNHEQFEKLMEEAKEKSYAFDESKFNADRAWEMAALGRQMAKIAPGKFDLEIFEDDMKRQERDMQLFDLDMKKMEIDMKKMEKDMAFMEKDLKELEKNAQAFETALKEELIKDGYLKKGEKLDDIRFSNDQTWVNGKKVKEADHHRYESIKKKYFKKTDGFYRVE